MELVTRMKHGSNTLILSNAPVGSTCIHKRVTGSGSTYQRLLEMGLVTNTRLKVVRLAPLGDPMEIELHGYNLSLRKAEAHMVEIEYV